MAFEAQLFGSLKFGNTDFDIEAVPDNKENLLFKGTMRRGGQFSLTSLVKTAFSNTLSIDIGDSTLPDVTFTDISFEIVKEQYASFLCRSEITWEKPFGIDAGFGLRSLTLYIKNTSSPTESKIIQVEGKLYFGKKGSEVQLNTNCFFSGGSPVLVAVNQIPAINSLNDVIHQFFGDTISWPTNLIDLSLTNSSIYYLSDVKKLPDLSSFTGFLIDKNNVQQGFNISTTAGISLADTAPVNIALNIGITGAGADKAKSPAGIKITAALTEPLDLIPNIIKFTGIDYAKGPSLQAQSYQNNSSFRFTCGVTFCSANFAAGTLDVTSDSANNSKKLTGNYTTAANLPAPFGSQKIEFTWTKPEGLIIKNLPFFSTIKALIDNAKYIEKIKKFVSGDKCGNIGELLFNRVIDTKFIISPSFATKFNGETLTSGVYIIVDGYYKISVEGYQITSIKMPSLAFAIRAPKEFSFDGIIGFIENLIIENVEGILKQLWDNKAELAKLLAVVMGKQALTEMVNKLTCEGLKQLLKAFADALLSTAGESVAAILGAAGGAVTAVTKTSGGGCGKSSDDDDDSGSSGGGGGGSDTPSAIRIASPKNVKAVYKNDLLSFSWEKGDEHANAYEYQLWAFVPLNPAKFAQMRIVDIFADKNDSGKYQGTINMKQFSYKGIYTFKVKALADAKSDFINSNNVTVDLQKLAGPATIGSDYIKASQQIKATWQLDSQAQQYEVFIQKDGVMVGHKTITKTTDGALATEALFELSDLTPLSTGPFIIGVRSIGNDSQIPSEIVQTAGSLVISYGIGTMAIGTSFKIN
jgi:hypothetical protein